MTLRSSSVRLLCRTGIAALLAGGVCVVGAPAASASVADSSDVAGSVVSADAAQAETGWLEEVRADSADSTKAVAGTVMVLVAGCITTVAVSPRRRPPAES
jgi:ABC-type uncharacterized transport system permease subunit